MSPIRVGLIGLGTASGHTTGAWGGIAHLPSLLASPHYEIVALCNSTVKSARASISHHKLLSTIKAYGSPEELANDPDVDLVVVSVKVARHYELIKPALLAGKDAFVEWPLGATTAEAEELTEIAISKGLKTFLGCQARADPLVAKVKELVYGGKIGKVLSSTATGALVGLPKKWPIGATYYQDMNSGGNVFTIYVGHFLDSFIHVLGNFASVNSILKVDTTSMDLCDPDGNIVEENHPKTTPDEVFIQGMLESGAVVSVTYRDVPFGKTIHEIGQRWIITGTLGEIELATSERMWQMSPSTTLKLRVGDGEVEDIDFTDSKEPVYVSGVGTPGINTARAYEAFAKGDADKYPSFEQGLVTHRLLDSIRAGHI